MDAPIEDGWMDFCDHLILVCDIAQVHHKINMALDRMLNESENC